MVVLDSSSPMLASRLLLPTALLLPSASVSTPSSSHGQWFAAAVSRDLFSARVTTSLINSDIQLVGNRISQGTGCRRPKHKGERSGHSRLRLKWDISIIRWLSFVLAYDLRDTTLEAEKLCVRYERWDEGYGDPVAIGDVGLVSADFRT